MKRAFGEFYILYEMTTSVRVCLSYDALKMGFCCLQNEYYFNTKHYVDTNVVNDVTSTRQNVITRVLWSYDFYDMTLSTENQHRHMIKLHGGLRLNPMLD